MTVETCETLTPMNDHYQLCPDGVDGPTPRSYWVVEGRLAAGAYPSDKGYTGSGSIPEPLEQLLDAGIGVFINLTQDHPGGTDQHLTRYDSGVEGRGEIVRYPIVDEALPEGGAGEMAVILNRIDAALDDGQNVYVHCWEVLVEPERWSAAGFVATGGSLPTRSLRDCRHFGRPATVRGGGSRPLTLPTRPSSSLVGVSRPAPTRRHLIGS